MGLFLGPLSIAIACFLLGWILAPQEPTIEILSMVIVSCVGLTLHQRTNRALIDALLILAAATSITGVLLTRATLFVFRPFGFDHLAATTGIEVLLSWVVPIAGAMVLLAVPQRLRGNSLGSALLSAALLLVAAAVAAFFAGATACVVWGARSSDYNMVVHNLSEIDVAAALPRAAVSLFVASLLVFVGVRRESSQKNLLSAFFCAAAAVGSVYAIHRLWPL